jgi:hypothetical protein
MEEYYAKFSKEEIQKLLMFTEMVVFHSLILLMNQNTDKKDLSVYEKHFHKMLKLDFINGE